MRLHRAARKGDLALLKHELKAGAFVDARDKGNSTPLMLAVSSPDSNAEVVRWLLERGADPNADGGDYPQTVLVHAVRRGDLARVELVLDAGADIAFTDENGLDALINAMHGRATTGDDHLLSLVELLIRRGAPLRGESDYGESALSVSSNGGRFDVVARLLEAGADESVLGWIPLQRAVAIGTLGEIEELLAESANLSARDRWERTPWLLSLCTGDVERARLLLRSGADRSDRGRCGKTALMYPAEYGHPQMLRWLLEEGFEVDSANEFGGTALMEAAERGDLESVQILVEAGAALRRGRDKAIEKTGSLDVIRFLLEHGADWSEVEEETRAFILGLDWESDLETSREDFEAAKVRRFGAINPEAMDFPFWQAMVRCGSNAYGARKLFESEIYESDRPVWCYKRFGKSITELPDGRFIEIGGEHEDSYDPDFCIYNDVFVHEGEGRFHIFGFPEDLFPPTDFHSATLVGRFIIVIGCLGYPDQRVVGFTPVYRLNIDTFSIERVETTGENPGWIWDHKAVLVGNEIHVSGGQLWTAEDARNREAKAQELEEPLDPEQPDDEADEDDADDDEDGEADEDDFLQAALLEFDNPPKEQSATFVLDLEPCAWRRVPGTLD